jgi:puromycin-sensitive aminopeptidase
MGTGIRTADGNFLSSYFATPYPLPKLDMIAIPDFATGAMENYGLVTYRDTALLYDELLSSASNKQQVRDTIESNSFISLSVAYSISFCALNIFFI